MHDKEDGKGGRKSHIAPCTIAYNMQYAAARAGESGARNPPSLLAPFLIACLPRPPPPPPRLLRLPAVAARGGSLLIPPPTWAVLHEVGARAGRMGWASAVYRSNRPWRQAGW